MSFDFTDEQLQRFLAISTRALYASDSFPDEEETSLTRTSPWYLIRVLSLMEN